MGYTEIIYDGRATSYLSPVLYKPKYQEYQSIPEFNFHSYQEIAIVFHLIMENVVSWNGPRLLHIPSTFRLSVGHGIKLVSVTARIISYFK